VASFPSSRLSDPRGNPSRWVALGFAAFLGLGAVAAALLGQGPEAIVPLAMMFVLSFNVAFGKRGTLAEIAAAFGRRSRNGGSK
jgi:hypothetical protein